MLLRFIPVNPNLQILKYRKIGLSLSILLTLATIALVLFKGLNFGIDFLGGSLIEVKTNGATISEFREKLGGLGIGEVALQEFGSENDILIRIQRQVGSEELQEQAIAKVQEAIKENVVEYRRIESVGPTVGAELKNAAIWATLAAITAIMIYVWFRFEWQFGVAAVASLIHDVVMTVGLFSLTGMEFNLAIVAALLTIAGYSINDTVVIFDRVRENLRKYKKLDMVDLLNQSVNETLSRTMITSFTTELALLMLVIFGGEVLRGFAIALIFGIFVGTYSTFFIAVPILNILKPERNAEALTQDNT